MAKNYFNRYVWLIDTVNLHGPIPLDEISRLWRRSALNETGGPLPERTFHNHRIAIEETMGIEIACDRSKGYYIANSGDLEGDGIRRWLLESMSLNNLLTEGTPMRDRILFERIPSSQKWLPVIVNAMRDRKALQLTYQSFNRDDPDTFTVHPYCLKLFRQRWYMLASGEGYDSPRIYSLDDRMVNVVQTKKGLKIPARFNAQDFFSNYFGIIVGSDREPCSIKIKVAADQAVYIDTLPLHLSQTLLERNEEYGIYKFHLAPTYDFTQEILSHGSAYEVLSPQWYRNEIEAEVRKMLKNYAK